MNRIDQLFLQKQRSILSVYFTAGYPDLADTTYIIDSLEMAGADLVEIGFPFSDPVADGPVIQASSHQALLNGMNLDILFEQLRHLKNTSRIPKILMGYFNPVYQFGVERFIDQCVSSGIDGIIIPDLPPDVYVKDYRGLFESAGIHFICLAVPHTSPERIAYLESVSRGFMYRLSRSSTTGTDVREFLKALPSDSSENATFSLPTLIGFGIHDKQTFEMACRHANGAIIGTGFIRFLNTNFGYPLRGEPRQKIITDLCKKFVKEIRG